MFKYHWLISTMYLTPAIECPPMVFHVKQAILATTYQIHLLHLLHHLSASIYC